MSHPNTVTHCHEWKSTEEPSADGCSCRLREGFEAVITWLGYTHALKCLSIWKPNDLRHSPLPPAKNTYVPTLSQAITLSRYYPGRCYREKIYMESVLISLVVWVSSMPERNLKNIVEPDVAEFVLIWLRSKWRKHLIGIGSWSARWYSMPRTVKEIFFTKKSRTDWDANPDSFSIALLCSRGF